MGTNWAKTGFFFNANLETIPRDFFPVVSEHHPEVPTK